MLNKIKAEYLNFLDNITWRDIVIFTTIVIFANEWSSIVALCCVFAIEFALMYAAFDFIPVLRTKLVFYGGIRKQIIQNLSIFSNAVGFKMIYFVSSYAISGNERLDLILQVILILIILPTLMNYILRYNSAN